MDTTMFQLRTFVHQRLSAAAEEILGEVEKTITVALNEAIEVCLSKEEKESLQPQLDSQRRKHEEEPSLTCDTANSTDRCEASLLHEDPGPSNPEETDLSVSATASQTGGDLDNKNWSDNFSETNPKVPEVKEEEEEEEELCDESQKLEMGFPFPEIVKTEEQLDEQTSHELHVVSLYCSEAQKAISDRREEFVSRDGEEAEITEGESLGPPFESPSADKEKGRSFCHVCGKGFQYIGCLMKHIKTHEKIDFSIRGAARQSSLDPSLNIYHNKANVCNVCGQTFVNNQGLRRHVKLHAGMKRFVCQECGKKFNRREHLVVHARTHSGEKPFHCDVCGKAFSQSQNLTIHKRGHSGEKPFHCTVCSKLFNTSSHLKRHMRYHSGEKPYTCDICGKRFPQSGQMTRHRTTHTGEKLHACQVCGIRYRFAPNLKAHMKTHVFRKTKN